MVRDIVEEEVVGVIEEEIMGNETQGQSKAPSKLHLNNFGTDVRLFLTNWRHTCLLWKVTKGEGRQCPRIFWQQC